MGKSNAAVYGEVDAEHGGGRGTTLGSHSATGIDAKNLKSAIDEYFEAALEVGPPFSKRFSVQRSSAGELHAIYVGEKQRTKATQNVQTDVAEHCSGSCLMGKHRR